jgi:hypothetical protein
MKIFVALIAASIALAQTAPPPDAAKPAAAKPSAPMPAIRTNGQVKQMMVDGKPLLMLAGELHNSSASSVEYMKPIWRKLAAMKLNTVIGTVSWELLEPQEGKYDFTLVDDQIRQARAHNMKLVLIWFGTWKNAVASYVPMWVKTDPKRFPRVISKEGVSQEELTPLGEESLRADAKAFRELMRHIRAADPQHTVIMMQVENETGKLHDSRDRSALAESAYAQAVPAELMSYLTANKDKIAPELAKLWGDSGFKPYGTWKEVFGAGPAGEEVFSAWHIARYVAKVVEAGKAELPIPMYTNAWLATGPQEIGKYPAGGPNPWMHDVWRAAAPVIDLLAPDIYAPDFKGVCANFTRNGNTLFIPEARASVPNLIWAIGHHAALGYSPFGIENLPETTPLAPAYKTLGGMIPVITKFQAEGKVAAVVQDQADQRSQELSLGGYKLTFTFSSGGRGGPQPAPAATSAPPAGPGMAPDTRSFALVINIGADEFAIAGQGVSVTFAPDTPGPKVAGIGTIDEGAYEKGTWIPGRRINGDENGGGERMILRGQGMAIQKVKLYRYE